MTNNEAIGVLTIVVETAKGRCFVTDEAISDAYDMAINALEAQKKAQEVSNDSSESDKEKISDLLRSLYLFGLVHFTKEGIVRKQHYCEELWKALFHDDEFPVWMHW